ncbi:hypothetical protein [Effusibacillus dendaii]|uniref:Uncharacterized protein n=1 Tax=Effusibacillus dendaii TaxID=2743772 RepID=A0A7I8D857_9BACL|nr:hypothetical protein [Effusibacillus dendaii]BCJ85552.1 hypothetical protein skT53_05370 [Effusibacillus dendaii]
MVKCPVCSELLELLTTVHCEMVHGLTRQQVIERYGKPESFFMEFAKKYVDSAPVIRKRDFVNSQLLTDRIRSKTRKFHIDR